MGDRPIATQALLLTGGLAVGKTAVAKEIVALAEGRGLRVAAIDLDWLGWVSDARLTVDQLICRNLAGVAENYAAAGIDRLVLARALVTLESLPAIRVALDGWTLTVVRLDATRETVQNRLRTRESGSELEDHLAHIDQVARLTMEVAAGAPVVINDERSLREVALDVMRVGGWIESSESR